MELKTVSSLGKGNTVSIYEGQECQSCPRRQKCTKGNKRKIAVDSREPFRERMREKLRSDHGRETYMKRQGIAEPVHGDDQKNKGWTPEHDGWPRGERPRTRWHRNSGTAMKTAKGSWPPHLCELEKPGKISAGYQTASIG